MVSQSTIGRRTCAVLLSAALLGRGEGFTTSSRASNVPRWSGGNPSGFGKSHSAASRLSPASTRLHVLSVPRPPSEEASLDDERGPQSQPPRPVRPPPRRRSKPNRSRGGPNNGKRYKGRGDDASFLRKRTEQLLRATDPEGNDDDDDSAAVKTDRRTFNWLLDGWAFSGLPESPSRVRSLLDRMDELGGPLGPDVRSYTKLAHAISRAGGRDAGRNAYAVLRRMEDMWSSGSNPAVRPNTFTYTAVAEAHANSGGGLEAAVKAGEVADLMERMRAEGSDDVRPTARVYSAVISAWAKAGVAGSAQRAEDCLDRMEELYASTDNDDVKPNVYNFNGVINAWANSGEGGNAARHAQDILERMERLSREEGGEGDSNIICPTTSSYNAAIDAWAKSGEEDAAERAEQLLLRMEEDDSRARPNTRSFNAVLNAWAKSRRPDAALRAEAILDNMERWHENGDAVGPDATSFSTAINAWGRSQNSDKAERALALYLRLKGAYESGPGRRSAANRHLRPTVVACNSVMNACAFSVGSPAEQSRAVEIAHMMLKELEGGAEGGNGGGGNGGAYGGPDQVTYGTFLKVCANQMEPGETRDLVADVVFRKCVRDGQVGEMVLRELEGLVSGPDMWEKLVGKKRGDSHTPVRPKDLPKSWTCNVVEGKWARRKRKLG
uniref:Pentacotripeptide-repeat region of PRORP domain-containing protein n=1 Tax=Odontella aurita TaxID=265563 RepID=A0A7S4I9D1_9STRA|mmetsp:Transcript_21543/g.63129  ORF Transcript_21543/g.63129 Transcript_21543/m.63129 type:complete len:667 (+) Transcript_21543:458-2458(+)